MMSFFKTFFACLLAIGVLIFIGFILIGSALMSDSKSTPSLEANTILNLTLKGEITDRAYSNPFRNLSPMAALTGSVSDASTIGLFELKEVLNQAKTDDHIKGVYLNLDEVLASPATMFELKNALEDFKTSKKIIYAYSNQMPEINLMLNTVADKFYMNPVGGAEFDGFAMQMEYYKNLMDKLGVEFKVFYVGEYKSATEGYRRSDMSPEDRVQRTELLNDISTNFLNAVNKNTKIAVDTLSNWQNNLSIMNANDMLSHKLIAGLKYNDEVLEEIKTKLGYKKDADLNMISYNDYNEIIKLKTASSSDNSIAVVYAEGEILDNNSDDGIIGGEAYVKLLQKIANDKSIKGLVLRVNSPGGSAFASEQIYHQIEKIKTKMPVVVSMGDYAASGGYYIAANADKIIAEPNTITGSIGIFGMVPDIRKALNEKVGVTFDEVKTAEHANFFSTINNWDNLELDKVQKEVEHGYGIFLDRVSKGRKMDTSAVNKIARGRVWTGQDALGIGLVDELGNLDLAIKRVKELAKIKEASIVTYPESKSMMESIMNSLMGDEESQESKMMKNLTPQLIFFKQLEHIQATGIYQYKIPYNISVK